MNFRRGIFIVPLLLAAGCATVPVTGRRSFNFVSESEETALGIQSYRDILKQSKLSTDAQASDMVRRVGERIAKVSDRPDFQWEYNLIDDPKTANAFCLPGGKVAVYTGILPITKNEAGLAVVLGHEIAHAVAKHGAERMSQQTLLSLGAVTLAEAMKTKPAQTREIFTAAYGLGAGVGVALPFGRLQESEADRIGLIYMAKAGYDPQEAVQFWQRMNALSKGQKPPQFLSTHPSDETRIRQIQNWMPEALNFYK